MATVLSGKRIGLGGLCALTTAAVFLVLAFGPPRAMAQDGMGRLLSPRLGNTSPSAEYEAWIFGQADTGDSRQSVGWTDHRLKASTPIMQSAEMEWTVGVDLEARLFNKSIDLPLSGRKSPEELWDLEATTTYRRKFSNGWIGGGSLSIGSASDKPFQSGRDLSYSLNVFVRIPHGTSNAWLLMVNQSNRRSFLQHIPFPGVAYMYQPSPQFMATIGIPFSVMYRPIPQLTLTAYYVPVRLGGVRANYRLNRSVTLHAGLVSQNDVWWLSDRDDPDRRLFYYDLQATVGITWRPIPWAKAHLTGGYSFDRFYSEGNDFGDIYDNQLRMDDTWLVKLQVGIGFGPGGGRPPGAGWPGKGAVDRQED